ncbi:hypothetical protein [Thermococcus sp.]|uniref:hypothetical protein n=1 Tax=Thermococcus sp. TaxID=35749 RepID=UPI0026321271|nr:hypothetical protein [Thermococcus sp.]MCD6144088.1 hypothetical protein [Thermococcus sp.]
MRIAPETLIKVGVVILLLFAVLDVGFVLDYRSHMKTVNKVCEAFRYFRQNESYFYRPNGSYYAHVFIKNYKDAKRFTNAFQKYRPLIAGSSSCNENRGVFSILVESDRYEKFVEEAGGHILWSIETPEEMEPPIPQLNKTGNMTYLRLECDIHTPYDYYHFAISLVKANAVALIVSLILVSRKYSIRDVFGL